MAADDDDKHPVQTRLMELPETVIKRHPFMDTALVLLFKFPSCGKRDHDSRIPMFYLVDLKSSKYTQFITKYGADSVIVAYVTWCELYHYIRFYGQWLDDQTLIDLIGARLVPYAHLLNRFLLTMKIFRFCDKCKHCQVCCFSTNCNKGYVKTGVVMEDD